MNFLDTAIVRLGFTRNDASWFWAQLLGLAAVITSNTVDIPAWFARLGITVTPTELHWISVVAAALLYFGGRYGTSPLPATPAVVVMPNQGTTISPGGSVTTPQTK